MSKQSKTFLSIIQHNITLWFLLPGMAFIALFGLWASMNRITAFRQTTAILAGATSQFVLDRISASHQILRTLSVRANRHNPARLKADLASFHNLYPHFRRLIWLTRDRRVQSLYPDGIEGIDFPLMIWETATDNLMISRPMPTEKAGDIVIYVAHILPDGEIIAGELSLGALRQHLRVTLPGELTTIIADKDGNLVVSSDEQQIRPHDNLQNLGIFENTRIPFFRGFFEKNNQLYFGVVSKFPRVDWIMVNYQPAALLFFPVIKITLILFSILFAFSAFFFFRFRYALQRLLLAPLKRFIGDIQAAAKGSYRKRRAADASFAELDIVESEFEKMTIEVQRREKKFRSLFDNAPEGIFRLTTGGRFLRVNPSMVKMLGCSSEQNVIETYRSIPNDLCANPKDWRHIVQELKQRGRIIGFETTLKRDDGGTLDVSLSAYLLRNDPDDAVCIEGSITDIGARRRAEERLRQYRNNLDKEIKRRTRKLTLIATELERRNQETELIMHMGDWLQACNTEKESFTVIASICRQIFPKHSGFIAIKTETAEMAQAVAGFGDYPWEDIRFSLADCWAVRRGGGHVVASAQSAPLCPHTRTPALSNLCIPITARSECLGVIHLCCDYRELTPGRRDAALKRIESQLKKITELYAVSLANIKLRERLHLQSIVDPLTGLFNRRHMEYALTREFDRATRSGTNVGLMMLDIDHFKQLNDRHGHEAGDKVLWKIGQFLKNSIRGEDIACRYGGEEFILILPGCSPEDCLQKADDIRQGIEKLATIIKKREHRVTVSIGISSFPQNGELIDEVIRAADDAMYEAKKAGRNRIVCAIGQNPA